MNSKIRVLLLGLVTLVFFEHCTTKTSASKPETTEIIPAKKAVKGAKLDILTQHLKGNGELTKGDLVFLGVLDSTYANAPTQTRYLDTTVQLNDSIFYSILTLSDEGGNCSHSFILTINEKTKRAVASKLLKSDCDIDYSWASYDLFNYRIISKNTIELSKTTVFQKKKRISDDDEENIDHKQTKKSYFIIKQSGQITSRK